MIKRTLLLAAGCMLALTAGAVAQQTPPPAKPESAAQAATPAASAGKLTPLRVQIVVSRYMGEKKIGSLPYTLFVTAGDVRQTSLRMGVEVPVPMTVFGAEKSGSSSAPVTSFSYRSVGTNIDCSASSWPDGVYKVNVALEDSAIQFDPKDTTRPAVTTVAGVPAFRTIKSNFSVLLRDGQTTQSTSATDPVSGEVLKVDVTLNVLK